MHWKLIGSIKLQHGALSSDLRPLRQLPLRSSLSWSSQHCEREERHPRISVQRVFLFRDVFGSTVVASPVGSAQVLRNTAFLIFDI